MNLVPCELASNRAVQSGEWDNPATWDHGIPGNNADVLIPEGISVLIDSVLGAELRTLRVDGELDFAPSVNTALRVDTIVVTPEGTLSVGSASAPILPSVQARITFADRGPIDTVWDPNLFSRGLISHGTVNMDGATKTPFAAISEGAKKKSSRITLETVPAGWQPGDQIVVTGVTRNGKQDEVSKIKSISGNVITLENKLRDNHATPTDSQSIYAANLTRNVVLESENRTDIARRGHVMFMHSPHVDVHNVSFVGLGRTDKRLPLNNVQLDAAGHLIPGTGTNAVGRYAVHFHRTGVGPGALAAEISGSVVVDSPGWGVVNHGSNVHVEQDVAYNVVGASFIAESGDEIGSFRGNIAIRGTGSSDPARLRREEQDFAHRGYGFWLQGAGTEVVDNIAVSQAGAGYSYFTRGLLVEGESTVFPAYNLEDPSIAGGRASIGVNEVPIREFSGNTAFASGHGLEIWYHLDEAVHNVPSVIDSFAAWNIRENPVFVAYSRQIQFIDVSILGNKSAPVGTGIEVNDAARDISYENVRVEGFVTGIAAPLSGTNSIRGGYLDNIHNIALETSGKHGRTFDIAADTAFGHTTASTGRADVYLAANLNPKDQDITKVFNPDLITSERYPGLQLYYHEQAPDFVPFPMGLAPVYVPIELIGKSNAQLFAEYGLAIGGAIAPAPSVVDPLVHATIGPPATYAPELELVSDRVTKNLAGYQLVYKEAGGQRVFDPVRVDLRLGWNLITRSIAGQNRTFLIFGSA